ncbi:N-acetylmuramoyl-L-alanine amidase [Pseudoclavibacter sp. 8L]|uniref:N-acetylmuramoyl-L-alanine amidase n=1 Tax=Pseudoclavibacter sp. 8L TaxID=2653162 RepID=UPI0012F14704|nr:peptidoglycan recognition family protein [Pseudoclavibacter sp. 8L]VXB29149.1 conserved hypothetical protein [Pseudoclavibacter sp. 8L]
MTFSNTATGTSGNGGQFSNRAARVDRFIVHHAATASLSAVLSMMSTGSRQVSASYVIKDGQVIGVVPEEKRAWTSGSAAWDGRAITVETCNSQTGDASGWPISEASYESLARLIADCATRYGFPINRDTVIGHRELYSRYGASYATACPGGINLDRLVTLAIGYQKNQGEKKMTPEQAALLADVANKVNAIRDGQLQPHKKWTIDQELNNKFDTLIGKLDEVIKALGKK